MPIYFKNGSVQSTRLFMKIGERNDNDNQNPPIISNLILTSCSTNSLPSRGKEKKQMGQIVGTLDSQDIEIVGCERKWLSVL